MPRPIGYALVGAGAFGEFCVEQYRMLDEVEIRLVCDQDETAARKVAEPYALPVTTRLDDVLGDPAIELVHLATPPFTHRELAERCLRAGKHVLCEKPLATRLDDAANLIDLARRCDRLLAVNLIMRYDPINHAVGAIVNEKLLGEVIAGSLVNLASDHKLDKSHWFWNVEKSGGIFIEHGVHFFDLLEMWLGPAAIHSAQQRFRPGAEGKIIEHVRCTAEHGDGILVDHYHGFHQAEPMDRQELRLICERGDIRIRGWLAESLEIDALLEDEQLVRLESHVGGLQTGVSKELHEQEWFKARHKLWRADSRARVRASVPMKKPALYSQCLRDLLVDQLRWIHDHAHVRRITEENGLTSLRPAVAATRLASSSDDSTHA